MKNRVSFVGPIDEVISIPAHVLVTLDATVGKVPSTEALGSLDIDGRKPTPKSGRY